MALLSLDAVSTRVGAVTVLDAVELEVAEGEALGVVGANGAGKSRLLDLIAGTRAPDSGRILIGGRDVTRASARARCRMGLGRTFQIPRPFETLTVFETLLVAAHGRGRSMRKAVDPCAEILARTGLDARADIAAGKLTLPERKRLELARALATEPRLLLLDEITAGLAAPALREVTALIRDLRTRGIALIWAAPAPGVLAPVADRVVALERGRLVGTGTPAPEPKSGPEVEA